LRTLCAGIFLNRLDGAGYLWFPEKQERSFRPAPAAPPALPYGEILAAHSLPLGIYIPCQTMIRLAPSWRELSRTGILRDVSPKVSHLLPKKFKDHASVLSSNAKPRMLWLKTNTVLFSAGRGILSHGLNGFNGWAKQIGFK
jgi:hypothetical protein